MMHPEFRPADGVEYLLDADDQPRVTLTLARYQALLALEALATGRTTAMLDRLLAIEAAAVAHVHANARMMDADLHHADRSLTYHERAAAMAALLVARCGVVPTCEALVRAVAR